MEKLASYRQPSRKLFPISGLKRWQLLLLTFTLCLNAHPATAAAAKQKATPKQTDACLASVPVTAPIPPAVRVVQLVNCSSETILGAANAAKNGPDKALTSIFPREGTWVMKPAGSPNNANVITLDIPPEWADTKQEGSVAPNIWARTGCRYDIAADKAQCETGGAGGVYDVSKAKLGPPGAATITEWTFYQQVTPATGTSYYIDNFDISAVNGVSLTVDILAVGGHDSDPGDPNSPFWLAKNAPLSVYGQDLRANSNCPDGFKLKRSDLTSEKYKEYGFVIEGSDGKPLGGDATVGCFSNCGKYKFPVEPAQNCDTSDPTCYRWKVFCAGDPTQYGASCSTDNDCPVLASCWNNPGSTQNQKCSLRGFIAKPPCPDDVCTFPYGYVNPASGLPDYSTQPPFGLCSDVDPNNPDQACIGDDTVHAVFPHAYTWPNDPQVYADDAPLYRVVFAPGGTSVPITPSVASLPLCSALTPSIYQPDQARTLCSIDIQNGAVFGIARPQHKAWSCNLGDGAGNDGVICRWNSQLGAVKPSFDGIPGKRNCRTRSHATLTRHFGSLRTAAKMHGYAGKQQLKRAVKAFCRK